jgi:hypothetical protein
MLVFLSNFLIREANTGSEADAITLLVAALRSLRFRGQLLRAIAFNLE